MSQNPSSPGVLITTLEPLILMSVCIEGAEIPDSEAAIFSQPDELPILPDGEDPLIPGPAENLVVGGGESAKGLPELDQNSNDAEWPDADENGDSDREFRSIDGTDNNPGNACASGRRLDEYNECAVPIGSRPEAISLRQRVRSFTHYSVLPSNVIMHSGQSFFSLFRPSGVHDVSCTLSAFSSFSRLSREIPLSPTARFAASATF